MEFIIVMRDDKYTLIGPFDDEDACVAWSDEHWNEPDHAGTKFLDSRWQSINLADPHAAPLVLDPSDPAAVAAIQE